VRSVIINRWEGLQLYNKTIAMNLVNICWIKNIGASSALLSIVNRCIIPLKLELIPVKEFLLTWTMWC